MAAASPHLTVKVVLEDGSTEVLDTNFDVATLQTRTLTTVRDELVEVVEGLEAVTTFTQDPFGLIEGYSYTADNVREVMRIVAGEVDERQFVFLTNAASHRDRSWNVKYSKVDMRDELEKTLGRRIKRFFFTFDQPTTGFVRDERILELTKEIWENKIKAILNTMYPPQS